MGGKNSRLKLPTRTVELFLRCTTGNVPALQKFRSHVNKICRHPEEYDLNCIYDVPLRDGEQIIIYPYTLLQLVCRYAGLLDLIDVVKQLLLAGADISTYRTSALHIVLGNPLTSTEQLIPILLTAGADINMTTPYPVLFLASTPTAAQLLLDAGADPNIVFEGKTAYDVVPPAVKLMLTGTQVEYTSEVCVVCMDKLAEVMFNCRHRCVCVKCTINGKFKMCPLCDATITERIW